MLISKPSYLASTFLVHATSFPNFFPLNVSTHLEYIFMGHR